MPPWDEDDFDFVHIYTRAQAIKDGVLVDVSERAREAGWKHPVALTIGAWGRCVRVDPSDPKSIGQSETGRLWDVLMTMTFAAVILSDGADRVSFTVEVSGEAVRLYSVCGPGDDAAPVVTVMLEGED